MHLIGRSVRADATLPDATKVPLISITDWDFNWQYYYQYAKPGQAPRRDHDRRPLDLRQLGREPGEPEQAAASGSPYGEQTADEMAFLIFDMIPAVAPTPPAARVATEPPPLLERPTGNPEREARCRCRLHE